MNRSAFLLPFTLAVALTAVVWSSAVRADPIVRITGAGQWATAISNGRVQGLNLNPTDPRFARNSAEQARTRPYEWRIAAHGMMLASFHGYGSSTSLSLPGAEVMNDSGTPSPAFHFTN